MKTILIPTDFSKAATKAVDLSINLARPFGSTLLLLHVLESVDEGSFNVEGEATAASTWEDKIFNMKMIQKAKKQLAQLEQQVAEAGVKVKTVLRLGDAYHGMQAIITEQKVDLVVMGTKGSTGYEGMLVGSNTEKVVRRSACPVLSVNEKSTVTPFKSIVWATALRDEELTLPTVLRKLMEQEGTTVHVVRINTPAWFIPDTIAKSKIEDFAKRMKLKNYTVNVFNDLTEEEGLIHFATAIDADLIALCTHGRTGLAHVLTGSIAEDVVNHAKRPVFTYVLDKKKKS
jgi:nucleotide-binding universal stress UspA family protein